MAFWRISDRMSKTGQTTDYTPAGRTCKDDGGEQKGIPQNYVVLNSGQFSGTTNITVNAKTDVHSNECVLERETGLMFSRYVSASVGPISDGKLYWDNSAGSDEDIFEYCDQANLVGLAGFSDWRVPNRNEIQTIMTGEAPSSIPDVTIFPSFPYSMVWTSTTRPNDLTLAYATNFTTGQIQNGIKITTTNYCLLVRGGV